LSALDILTLRAALLAQVRTFFAARGFLEVETPLLSGDLILDREIEPWIAFAAPRPHDALRPLYLQSSPEAHMKRLLVRGAGAIFQVTRSFRAGERGPLHRREFTILEWYRPGDDLAAGMSLLSDLCEAILARGAARQTRFQDAYQRWAGVDPLTASAAQLREAARRGEGAPPDLPVDDRDGWLDYLMATVVGPRLGRPTPEILHDFPVSGAALAKIRDGDPPVAERFELFVDGIELANGYHEETSAAELARRQDALRRARSAAGLPPLPSADRWLAEIAGGLPPCAGAALGFDRIVMLAAGASSLDEVTLFGDDPP
jgi:lysyl-tRNA synthetase class 2